MITTNNAIIWEGVWHSGDGEAHVFPECWTVCPNCDGKGTEVNPAVDGFSPNDIDPCDREDFLEGYFSGRYDVTCSRCKGRTTVKGYNLAVLTPELREEYDRDLNQYYSDLALERAERRATGCGY